MAKALPKPIDGTLSKSSLCEFPRLSVSAAELLFLGKG